MFVGWIVSFAASVLFNIWLAVRLRESMNRTDGVIELAIGFANEREELRGEIHDLHRPIPGWTSEPLPKDVSERLSKMWEQSSKPVIFGLPVVKSLGRPDWSDTMAEFFLMRAAEKAAGYKLTWEFDEYDDEGPTWYVNTVDHVPFEDVERRAKIPTDVQPTRIECALNIVLKIAEEKDGRSREIEEEAQGEDG